MMQDMVARPDDVSSDKAFGDAVGQKVLSSVAVDIPGNGENAEYHKRKIIDPSEDAFRERREPYDEAVIDESLGRMKDMTRDYSGDA